MPRRDGKWYIKDGCSPLGKFVLPRDKSIAGESKPESITHVQHCYGLDSRFASALSLALDDWKDYAGDGQELGSFGWVSHVDAGKEYKNGKPLHLDNIRFFGWGLAAEISGIHVGTEEAYERADSIEEEFDACLNAYGLALYSGQKGKYICPLHVGFDDDASTVTYDEGYYERLESGDGSGEIGEAASASVASMAYYFSNQFEQIGGQLASLTLRGNRALANDKPLFDTIKSAVNASLRSFASGPNGEFVAWFPDYWGLYGAPTLVLSDMELIDLTIEKDSESFYSHVYCSGVRSDGSSVGFDMTQGVVSIESNIDAAASSAALNESDGEEFRVSDKPSFIIKALLGIDDDDPDAWKYSPKELYRRYGARPKTFQAVTSIIESGSNADLGYESNPEYILPFLNALYQFMELWSKQVKCTLSITYMPCLRPGMRIRLESMDLEMYVESVTHTMNYTTGFTTSVTCKCPKGSLVSGMVNPDFEGAMAEADAERERLGEVAKDGMEDVVRAFRDYDGATGVMWRAQGLVSSLFDATDASDGGGGEPSPRIINPNEYSTTGGGTNIGVQENVAGDTDGWDPNSRWFGGGR